MILNVMLPPPVKKLPDTCYASFAALNLAQRAFWAALMRANPAALNLIFFLAGFPAFPPLNLAQRAF